jgi:hypothetical protein
MSLPNMKDKRMGFYNELMGQHDHRALLSPDDFHMAVYEAMDGCDEGIHQVYVVTEDELEDKYGEDGYVIANLSETDWKSLFNLIAETFEDYIQDEKSGWHGFEYKNMGEFESLPMLSDRYIPDEEDVEPLAATKQPVKLDSAMHYDEDESTKTGRRKFEEDKEESHLERCTRLQREELHHQFDVHCAIAEGNQF